MISFIKKHRGISLVALMLTSTSPSFAFLDGDGRVINDGKVSYSCNYKGYRLRCHYDDSIRRCLTYEVLDKDGGKIKIEDLNPGGCLIELDPNTGACKDIEDSCIQTNYPCC